MRRFDTVLFDLDGTLLDTLEDICGAANHTLRELGYPERTLAEMRRFVGNGAEMQMRRALGADADEETVAKALALYKPYYAAHCQIKTKPYAGVLELMAALKAEGFRLAVVSNKPDEAMRPLVAQHFGALADIAMGETAQRRRKPAPDMVNDALAALGADKSRAVYVGDSEVDIETARNAGIPCISVTWGFRDREQLLEAGATVRAYDPVAANESRRRLGEERVYHAASMYEAAEGADAVALITEWKQFRMPDWTLLRSAMRDNIIVDGRNILDKEEALNAGFRYYGIGK